MKNSEKTLDMIVNLCKNRGFIYPGSEIYGGLANSWDYGPLGVEFKNNVKKAWMKKFVQESPYNVGLDAAILMNPQTWVTTGHVSSFSDPLLDCRACKSRHRADKLISECEQGKGVDVDALDMIVNLCKNRGFIYPGSEIYGGLANSWDYGPLGVEFKNNVKKAWMKKFVQESPYNVGLDAAILMNPQTWVTTGHVSSFSDPLLDCRACKSRHRADKLISECEQGKGVDVDAMTFDEMDAFIASHDEVVCPVCGKHDFTPIRKFNLMFKTAIGVTEDSSSTCYLRPETAQGIFVNFANIQRTTRRKLPFGVCQVGKAFRNEITPGNFTFRTREFEQMECEFFCKPDTDLEWFAYWKDYCKNWLLSLGIQEENLRLRDHEPAELAFYSRATTDIEYAFPFTDWGELWGIADRTNYDLSRHQEASGKSLEYFDPETNEHYIPYVIEPSLGCDRVALAFLCEAYDEQHLVDAKGKEDVRTVLHLHPYLAPFKCAVLPLSKKLGDKAMEIRNELAKDFMVDYDDAGSIGKRYRRQDEIGTPLCITVDFQTVGDDKVEADGCVTVRDRDTMEQVRMPISELRDYVAKKVAF